MTSTFARIGFAIVVVAISQIATLSAASISYTGNLRTDADSTSCGAGCVLDGGSLDVEWLADNHIRMTGPVATSFIGELPA